MTGPHPVPAAIGQLHAAVVARLDDQVLVELGLQAGDTEALDSVVVGLAPDDDSAVAGECVREIGEVGHEFEIPCAAMSLSGDEDDMLARLARCYELVDEVQAVLDELREQDGPIWWGRVVRHAATWRTADTAGTGAQVVFAVAASAFRDEQEL